MLYSDSFSHLFNQLFYFCRAAVSDLTRAADWHGQHGAFSICGWKQFSVTLMIVEEPCYFHDSCIKSNVHHLNIAYRAAICKLYSEESVLTFTLVQMSEETVTQTHSSALPQVQCGKLCMAQRCQAATFQSPPQSQDFCWEHSGAWSSMWQVQLCLPPWTCL